MSCSSSFFTALLRQSPPHEFSVKMEGLERYRVCQAVFINVIDAADWNGCLSHKMIGFPCVRGNAGPLK